MRSLLYSTLLFFSLYFLLFSTYARTYDIAAAFLPLRGHERRKLAAYLRRRRSLERRIVVRAARLRGFYICQDEDCFAVHYVHWYEGDIRHERPNSRVSFWGCMLVGFGRES